MENQSTIRNYTISDKEAILNLLRLNTPAYFSAEEEKDLNYYLDHEIEQYFVLELNQHIVGCGGINFSEDNSTGIISWDIIHPEFQGQSLGSKLLKYRIGKLQQLETVHQIIVRTSQLSYTFYEKLGFQLLEVMNDYWAKGFHLYKMKYVHSTELSRTSE